MTLSLLVPRRLTRTSSKREIADLSWKGQRVLKATLRRMSPFFIEFPLNFKMNLLFSFIDFIYLI